MKNLNSTKANIIAISIYIIITLPITWYVLPYVYFLFMLMSFGASFFSYILGGSVILWFLVIVARRIILKLNVLRSYSRVLDIAVVYLLFIFGCIVIMNYINGILIMIAVFFVISILVVFILMLLLYFGYLFYEKNQ